MNTSNKCSFCIYKDILNRCLKCKHFYVNSDKCSSMKDNYKVKDSVLESIPDDNFFNA
jgi:hypothetical protein